MILHIIDESWFYGNGHVVVNIKDMKPSHVVLSPNLTTCHPSFTDEHKQIKCCPPKHEFEEPFICYFPDPLTQPIRVRRPTHVMDKDADFVAKYNKAIAIMKSLMMILVTSSYNQQYSYTLMNVHMSWMFFPWHRMMISHLPPQVVDGNYQGKERGLGWEKQKAYNVALMYTQMISAAKKPELFMGCPYKAGKDAQYMSSNLNPERENMGALYSAARDPIIYSHHSNVDRLWEVWRNFILQTSLLVKIRDVLDITKLRHTFDWVKNPWINARPKPAVPPNMAREMLKMKNNNAHDNFQVQRPRTRRTNKEIEYEEEVLVVYGIDVKKDFYAKFDVYINARIRRNFVNMHRGVTVVMNKDDIAVDMKISIKLGISELLQDLEADGDESISVSLVPKGDTGVYISVDGVRIEYLSFIFAR
ncbi:hypothetical protein MKX01_023703 [Papaver californicum]|nr:hypothetical protein MKX01_023703 [Papaver californicum]